MDTLIISYSHTGNNGTIARDLAHATGAEHHELQEIKGRNVFTILLDVVFNRKPQILPLQTNLSRYNTIIFVAPIWFGKVASPLRRVFSNLNGNAGSYAFVSLSAGPGGKKQPVTKELTRRTGKKPQAVINPLISEILPSKPTPTRKQLDEYRISEDDANQIVQHVVRELKIHKNESKCETSRLS